MTEKPWYLSKTVWGAIVTIAASLAGMYGIEIDQAGLTETILQLVAAIGGAVAVWGRITAKTRLG